MPDERKITLPEEGNPDATAGKLLHLLLVTGHTWSVAELATELVVRRQTVSKLVRRFVADGRVVVAPEVLWTYGKAARLYRRGISTLNELAHYYDPEGNL